jgi:ATP-binding cassette subfamily G (WHITE) protein 1
VNAISNGKHDVREGYPFPEKEMLNNSNLKDDETTSDNTNAKDRNDANSIEDKFSDNKINEKSNGSILPSYAKNDIIKQST